MTDPNIPIGCTAIKPVERKGLEAISWFLYDKNTGAIMGRTPISWLKITIFYIIYYGCLAGFWALMLFIFFQTVDDKTPTWAQDNGIIGRSPALGVRPGQTWELIDSSILMFRKDQEQDIKDSVVPGYFGWVNRTNEFLAPYKKTRANSVNCAQKDRLKDQFCQFDIGKLGKCQGGNFGYDKGQPCIILKLNRIFGMVPDWYNTTASLPADVPAELKTRVAATTNKNQVWVECHGENAADQEKLGPIEYYPKEGGFPDTYFPFNNEKDYQSPLLAVKFLNPPVGQMLHVECRAWAANIGYHKRDRIGRAHFELMIHTSKTAKKVDNTYQGIVEE